MWTTSASADFNITLEEHLHPIWELERLDVIVHNQSSSRTAGICCLLPLTKQLLLPGTAIFVRKLKAFCTTSIVVRTVISIAIPNRYIVLSPWISQVYQDAQRFTDLDDTGDRRNARVRSSLDVHPTLNSSGSGRNINNLQHIHDERLEENGILLLLDLTAGDPPSSIPRFLDIFIALDDQHVVHGRTHRARWFASAAVERNGKGELTSSPARRHITTLWIVEVTLAIDDALEVRLELDGYEHSALLITRHIDRLDVGMIVAGCDGIGLPGILPGGYGIGVLTFLQREQL